LSLVTEDKGHPQRGHSTLRRSYEEKLRHTSVVNERVKRNPLQAISTLLVRQNEVVAVAACKAPIAKFAVLANPDHKDNYPFGRELYTLVPPGRSCWNLVRNDKWYGLTGCVLILILFITYLHIVLHTGNPDPSEITSPL
jgi:hypothetical protein